MTEPRPDTASQPARQPLTSGPDSSTPKGPGWPEIVVGLAGMAVFGFGGVKLLATLNLDSTLYGLILTGWSGVGGIAAFAVAASLRIRSLAPFGIVRTSPRWLLIGLGAGAAATAVKIFVSIAWVLVAGEGSNPQTVYAEGASGGALFLVLAVIFLGLLTPFGEELVFRGILTNALLRYGPVVGVVGSSLIFGLFHGINIILPAAIIAGLFAGEVFRRSGSIWPAVIVHVVFNLPTPIAMVAVGMS